ncbi:hypothetical protein Tco_0988112 [Tanacetum coccineum]|uniref:Uncharacterized protein n=1 Tax=Tanacetum coccineum TaxID=301880 RepID=A0ABQ5EQS4_9ASTR
MNKKKFANKNTTNYRLYHALMEALIVDEDAMDKEVADKALQLDQTRVGLQKIKNDLDSAVLAFNLQLDRRITDTRDAGADSSMHRSDPESETLEQFQLTYQAGWIRNDLDIEDTDNAQIPKGSADEQERRKLCKADLKDQLSTWLKPSQYMFFLQYSMDECHKLLTNKVDLSNPEGHQILRNVYEPLPLGGPPGQYNKGLELGKWSEGLKREEAKTSHSNFEKRYSSKRIYRSLESFVGGRNKRCWLQADQQNK